MSLGTLRKAQEFAQAGVLYAPANFKTYALDDLAKICNGCGATDSWFRPPERIYGTQIVYACHIHDFMYENGFTIEDKEEADRVFLNNLLRLIERDSHKWYKPSWAQRIRANTYYNTVCRYGGPAFWKGKN